MEEENIIERLTDLTLNKKARWQKVRDYMLKTETIEGIIIYLSMGGPDIFALTVENKEWETLRESVAQIGWCTAYPAYRRLWALARNSIYEEEILQKFSQ